jgi:hypothetical protein
VRDKAAGKTEKATDGEEQEAREKNKGFWEEEKGNFLRSRFGLEVGKFGRFGD